MNKSKIFTILFAAFCVLVAVFFANNMLNSMQEAAVKQPAQSETMGPIGFDYTLTDQDGESFKRSQLDGQYQLVYFGFTYCPDICPVELTRISEAMKALGADAAKVTPVFISVDPVRDTPEVLQPYLSNYHDRFVGLTGTEAQIDKVIESYKVYAKKVDDPNHAEYMVDHSSFIYLIDPQQELLKLFHKEDTPADIAKYIRTRF